MSEEREAKTRKPRRADEIERKIERGVYEHGTTLRDIYGDIAAADIIKMPKFRKENRALAELIIVMLDDAEQKPGLIGRTFAEMKIVDVSLGRFYDALNEVDPAEPDADEQMRRQIAFLYHDRKGKIKKHQEQGKVNQEKADTADAQRAFRDIETALERVHDRMTRGETNLNAVCNWVILHFTPIGRKDEDGRYKQYAPLMSAKGKPLKYETLAKYYRKKYGTKRERKANAAKNKARTQAARNAKAARSKRKK